MKVENFKRFSLKMLCCKARAFPVCTSYGYTITRPFFLLCGKRACVWIWTTWLVAERIRSVWNQLGKLKMSCTRPVKERQKFMSELCIGMNKTECAWQAIMRVSRGSDRFYTSTITCTAALRVWHFSTFHYNATERATSATSVSPRLLQPMQRNWAWTMHF